MKKLLPCYRTFFIVSILIIQTGFFCPLYAQQQQYAAYWNERNKLDDARKARDAVHLRMTQEIVDAKLDTFNGTKWECSLADTPLRPSRQYLVVALGLLCFGIIVSIQGLGLLAKAKHISAK